MVFVESYYEIMAGILSHEFNKLNDWKAVANLYESNKLKVKFQKMKELILQDNLFDEIREKYPGKIGEDISNLLKSD